MEKLNCIQKECQILNRLFININGRTIALNILYIKEKEICPANTSKPNWYCEKQTILLMISNKR